MKSILKYLVIALLVFNGIIAIDTGFKMLHQRQYPPLLSIFLLPSILLFILLGVTSIILSLFIRKHLFLLICCAFVEGAYLVFSLAEQEVAFHHLFMFYILLGLEWLALIITGLLLMRIGETTSTYKPPKE